MSNVVPPLVWFLPEPPGRDHLSRDRIVAAAVEVADRRGIAGLTMTAVGEALGGYTAMALYRYVGNKDGLVDLMLDRVVAEAALPDPAASDWQAAMRRLGLDTWDMAARHPWYAAVVDQRPPLGPSSMARTEAVLELLAAAGFGLGESLEFLQVLDRFVLASAASEARRSRMAAGYGIADAASFERVIEALAERIEAAERYPLLLRWMRSPTASSERVRLVRALDLLIDGLGSGRRSAP